MMSRSHEELQAELAEQAKCPKAHWYGNARAQTESLTLYIYPIKEEEIERADEIVGVLNNNCSEYAKLKAHMPSNDVMAIEVSIKDRHSNLTAFVNEIEGLEFNRNYTLK